MMKKFWAECIGTFVLVFIACGVAALTGGNVVATALAFGLVLVAMAYSVGRISGCHINPAVSLAMLLRKKMTMREFFLYVMAQMLGAFLGAVLLFGICKMAFGDGNLYNYIGDASNYAVFYGRTGELTAGNVIGALLAEMTLTIVFVYTVLSVTDEKAGNGKIAGIVIGLALTLVHLVGIGLTGTSVNPARSLATAIATAIYGGGTEALAQVWMFIVAPLVGGAEAAMLYGFLHNNKEPKLGPTDAE